MDADFLVYCLSRLIVGFHVYEFCIVVQLCSLPTLSFYLRTLVPQLQFGVF